MDFNEYQAEALKTAVYQNILTHTTLNLRIMYTALGLNGEAGEVAELIKKMVRDETALEDNRGKIAQELGDVLWYIANLGNEIGVSLETIALANLHKLDKRKQTGTLKGEREDD